MSSYGNGPDLQPRVSAGTTVVLAAWTIELTFARSFRDNEAKRGPVSPPPVARFLLAGRLMKRCVLFGVLAVWTVASIGLAADEPTDPGVFARARAMHWAFQPVREPKPPVVSNTAWVSSPLDAFILARLEVKGLSPSPSADRRTLIRRASFDLIGLPPTPDEVEAFVHDPSSDAYRRLLDRLLASPHYGERWGRHWLDVARYADTRGYALGREPRFPFAYTYRDYVIRAFNDDVPFSRFILEQLAADQLDADGQTHHLAGMGFLTVGRRFLSNHDTLDDRIDVVTRGFLGLTVTCARCHHHKFDPISSEDYYSLYGVFASSVEPPEAPLIGQVPDTQAYRAFDRELRQRRDAVEAFRREKHAVLLDELRMHVADYLAKVAQQDEAGSDAALSFAPGEVRPRVVRRWQAYLKESVGPEHPVFGPWHKLLALDEDGFAEAAARLLADWTAPSSDADAPPIDARLLAALRGQPPKSRGDVIQLYGSLLTDVYKRQKAADADDEPPDPSEAVLRAVLYAPGSPTAVTLDESDRLYDRETRNRLRELRTKVERWKVSSPAAPPRAMTLVDAATPFDPHVFVRGNPRRKGKAVPRRFLQVLSKPGEGAFRQGSGRLELARAIARQDNPLTARVWANRVWMHHFGAGLVNTPSDFGRQGDPPTHPRLLDHLAWTLMQDGWSTKALHRRIMLSNTYRQVSLDRPAGQRVDPENRLLWRANRRRLELEPLRDAMLAVAGRLDTTTGGRSVDLLRQPFSARRAVYGFIDRQDLPSLFRVFDLASPDASTPKRAETTVPQQALFLMNGPFIIEQARHLAARNDLQRADDDAERIHRLYRHLFGRKATSAELRKATAFLADQPRVPVGPDHPSPAWQYGYGRFDVKANRVVGFTALPHFTERFWQASEKFPSPTLGHLRLSNRGGHVGPDRDHAVIRRWIAPRSGVVKVSGQLEHESEKGDGVQAWIVSSRQGALGHWVVHNHQEATTVARVIVQRGDTLDFVVDGRTDPAHDTFKWAPVIGLLETKSPGDGTGRLEWNAAADFAGPTPAPPAPLTAWEQYVHVLLLTNEFVFVD